MRVLRLSQPESSEREQQILPVTRIAFILVMAVFAGPGSAHAQGLMIPGVGARNRSFGGAATGNSLDAPGAIFFNPATMSKIESNNIVIGAEIPFVKETTASSFMGQTGKTEADVGIFPLSTTSILYHSESNPDLTYGLGLFSAGGLFSNYPGDADNPVLQAPPPNGAGAGPLFSLLSLLQFSPAVSYQWSDAISFGAGPIVTLANLQLSPASLAQPDDADGDGFPSYPAATGTHPHYGLGFQVGVYVETPSGFNLGFSYKSPNWIEQIKVNGQNEIGEARKLQFHLDLPPVYSLGFSYAGIPSWLFAADIRYVDYNGIETLSDSGFDGLAVRGVGWESAWSLSLGTQYEVNEAVSVRAGWFVCESPIPGSMAAFNIGAPAYYRNLISTGMTIAMTKVIDLDVAYYYAPTSSIRGPIQSPAGPLADSSVENSVRSHAILFSMNFDY